MKPFDVRTDVTLECPLCRAYKTTMAGLAMAAMKIMRDVSDWLESDH